MNEVTMAPVQQSKARQGLSAWSGTLDKTVIASLMKFGIATVLVLLYYLQIIKPDADARRDAERATAAAVIETTVTQRMIVEQLRRNEDADISRDRMMAELQKSSHEMQKSSQEMASILRDILENQKAVMQ